MDSSGGSIIAMIYFRQADVGCWRDAGVVTPHAVTTPGWASRVVYVLELLTSEGVDYGVRHLGVGGRRHAEIVVTLVRSVLGALVDIDAGGPYAG